MIHLKREGTLLAVCGVTGYRIEFTSNPEEVECSMCKKNIARGMKADIVHKLERINTQGLKKRK